MNGSLFYGPKGRLISALAMISAFVGALQASGFLALLPQKYAWAGLVVTALGLFVAGFSERIQGGASNPEVRALAKKSDEKNAREEIVEAAEEKIELDEINR
jgi:hypothetical protein